MGHGHLPGRTNAIVVLTKQNVSDPSEKSEKEKKSSWSSAKRIRSNMHACENVVMLLFRRIYFVFNDIYSNWLRI